jgi:hypothetical protein
LRWLGGGIDSPGALHGNAAITLADLARAWVGGTSCDFRLGAVRGGGLADSQLYVEVRYPQRGYGEDRQLLTPQKEQSLGFPEQDIVYSWVM